jgi:hypothetical protein
MGDLMHTLHPGRNSLADLVRPNLILTIKTFRAANPAGLSPKKQMTAARRTVLQEKSGRDWKIVLSEVTPNHILAFGFLILTITCSIGAIMPLAFGALGLFPILIAVDLFLKAGGGSVISGVLWILVSRRHSH